MNATNVQPNYAVERRLKAHQLRARGLSQRAIAAELGVHHSKVQRYLSAPPPQVTEVETSSGLWRPPGAPFDLGFLDESGIKTYGWSLCLDPTFDALSLLRGYARGAPSTSYPEIYWDVEDSRWDQPDKCFCSFVLYRRWRTTGQTVFGLMTPDDPENDVRPLIRCPGHNAEVRHKFAKRVEITPEVVHYQFMKVEHSRSAIEYARRKDIPYFKVSYQTTMGWMALLVAPEEVAKHQKTKQRARETKLSGKESAPRFDWALRVIDPMTHLTAHGDWRVNEVREDKEIDEDIQSITGSAWVNPAAWISQAIDRPWDNGDVLSDEEWVMVERSRRQP